MRFYIGMVLFCVLQLVELLLHANAHGREKNGVYCFWPTACQICILTALFFWCIYARP